MAELAALLTPVTVCESPVELSVLAMRPAMPHLVFLQLPKLFHIFPTDCRSGPPVRVMFLQLLFNAASTAVLSDCSTS